MNVSTRRFPRLVGITVLLLVVGVGIHGQPSEGQQITNPELRQELLRRAEEDRKMRKELISADAASQPSQGDLAEAVDEMDLRNTDWLKSIVNEYGWPTPELVGMEGVRDAFLLLQHSPDLSFQERMLPEIRRAYEAGHLSGQQYALLHDRVRVRQERPQKYGTQVKPVSSWENGQPRLHPIENRSDLAARRRSLGLPPIDTYLDLIERLYSGREARGADE